MSSSAGADRTDPVAGLLAALVDRQPHVMVPDLSRIADLLDLLGSPQRAFPSVHLTGTNGKTSTARMIDTLLRGFGLRTGRYTSPHLQSVTERISVAGEPVTPERLAEVYAELVPYLRLVDDRHPERVTFFELLTALAFAVFADAPVDAAVLEVGLGGTWDATNVVHAPVAVVLPVDLDHTELLGDTVAEVATEKAGIIHPGALAVLAVQPPEALEVLVERSRAVAATPLLAGVHFALADRRVALGGQLLTVQGLAGSYPELFLPLHGEHQAHNAVVALAATEAFLGGGERRLDVDTVRAAFAAMQSPGRLELVGTSPSVLLDAAHNPAGARALAAGLVEAFGFTHRIGVLAVLADKDVAGMLDALEPVLSELVVTENTSPRRMAAADLADLAGTVFGADRVTVAPRLADALVVAVERADRAGEPGTAGVVVTGSVVTVGEARTLLDQ